MDADQVRAFRSVGEKEKRLPVLAEPTLRPLFLAEDVAKDVCLEMGIISPQRLYNALEILSGKRIFRGIKPAGIQAFFANRVNAKQHHLICLSKEKTVDGDWAISNHSYWTAADDSGPQIGEAEVIPWGICPGPLGALRFPPGR